jgi:hypothetical protein
MSQMSSLPLGSDQRGPRAERSELQAQRHLVAEQLTPHQGDDLANDVIDVERRSLGVGLYRQRADTLDHLHRPIAIVDDPLQGATRFNQVGSSAIEPAQAGLGVGDDCGERLVHFVGDRGSQLSQRRHARAARRGTPGQRREARRTHHAQAGGAGEGCMDGRGQQDDQSSQDVYATVDYLTRNRGK